jgi:hypothetical protein
MMPVDAFLVRFAAGCVVIDAKFMMPVDALLDLWPHIYNK